jgi:hypothetical protein
MMVKLLMNLEERVYALMFPFPKGFTVEVSKIALYLLIIGQLRNLNGFMTWCK